MQAIIALDGKPCLTLRILEREWPYDRSIAVHEAAGSLSCGLSPETPRHAVLAWLHHLTPENGLYERAQARARRKLRERGASEAPLHVGHVLWGNADREYAGKVVVQVHTGEGESPEPERTSGYVAVSEREVARALVDAARTAERRDGRQGDERPGRGQVLSGQRGKISLAWNDETRHWEVPVGEALGEYVVKEESSRAWLPAEAAVESYCQRTLRLADVDAAPTWARVTGGIACVVSQRSDRRRNAETGTIEAVHQEEWSQAIRIEPYRKAEDETGQGWPALMRLLAEYGWSPEVEQYRTARAMTTLMLLGCGDAHRRNVGIQHVPGQEGRAVRLAPLYDTSSTEGTEWAAAPGAVIAIGGASGFDDMTPGHWSLEARLCGVDSEMMLEALSESAARLPDALRDARAQAREDDEYTDRHAWERRVEAIREATERRCRTTATRLGQSEAARAERARWRRALEKGFPEYTFQEGPQGITLRVRRAPDMKTETLGTNLSAAQAEETERSDRGWSEGSATLIKRRLGQERSRARTR